MHVQLVTPDLAALDAALDGPAALAQALGCEVAEGWAVFPGAVRRTRDAVAADPPSVRWGTRFFVAGEPRTLVGWGGFKGPPLDGAVELGYAVVLEMSGFVHDGTAEQDDVGTVWRFRRDRQDGPQPRGDRPDGREQPGMGDRRAG